jgi:hypothetical protein
MRQFTPLLTKSNLPNMRLNDLPHSQNIRLVRSPRRNRHFFQGRFEMVRKGGLHRASGDAFHRVLPGAASFGQPRPFAPPSCCPVLPRVAWFEGQDEVSKPRPRSSQYDPGDVPSGRSTAIRDRRGHIFRGRCSTTRRRVLCRENVDPLRVAVVPPDIGTLPAHGTASVCDRCAGGAAGDPPVPRSARALMADLAPSWLERAVREGLGESATTYATGQGDSRHDRG